MKFAIVGCGRTSATDVEPVRQIESAELVACADSDIKKATTVGQNAGCEAYDDYRRMLNAHSDDDVGSALTPRELHPEHVIVFDSMYKCHLIVKADRAAAD